MANKPIGFCESYTCLSNSKGYYKLGQMLWAAITCNKDVIDCPYCGYSLYWTMHYSFKEKLSEGEYERFQKRLLNHHKHFDKDNQIE